MAYWGGIDSIGGKGHRVPLHTAQPLWVPYAHTPPPTWTPRTPALHGNGGLWSAESASSGESDGAAAERGGIADRADNSVETLTAQLGASALLIRTQEDEIAVLKGQLASARHGDASAPDAAAASTEPMARRSALAPAFVLAAARCTCVRGCDVHLELC